MKSKSDNRRLSQEEIFSEVLDRAEIMQVLSEKIGFGGTVFLLDFYDLKMINDRFGHKTGDEVLEDFAMHLKRLCRDSDIIGRSGGDEFLIFMPQQIFSEVEIEHIVARFQKSMQEQIKYIDAGATVQKGASITVLVAEKGKYQTAEEVLKSLNASSDQSIFTHVFPTMVQNVLTREETTAALSAMNAVLYGNYFIRLRDMSYVPLRELEESRRKPLRHLNANEMLIERIKVFVKPEYKEMILEFADLTTLAERMADVDRLTCEYQDIEYGWCVASFVVTKREKGTVEQVMLLQTNITDAKEREQQHLEIQKRANELLNNSKLLFVGLIEKATGKTQVIQTTQIKKEDKVIDFEKMIEREATYLLANEQEDFLDKIQLNRICKELENHKKYTVSAILKKSDMEHRYMQYHFTELGAGENIVAVVEDVTERISYDNITEQLNFEGFKLQAAKCLCQNTKKMAIVNFNICNFKAINNTHGFSAGNWMLKQVYQKLMESELSFLVLCRENADNFFGLCPQDMLVPEKIDAMCKMEIEDENKLCDMMQLFCGIYNIEDTEEAFEKMCDKARLTRKRAERETGVNYLIFDQKVQEQYLDEATILRDIPRAIRNKELLVYYQPIFDAQTRKIASAEALIRWKHPDKGMISPGLFIPTIEKTGEIAAVDFYVAQNVYADIQNRVGNGKRVVPVSLNMSRYDFLRKSNMDAVRDLLKMNPEYAELIRIEITESGFINIPDNGEMFISELRQYGVKTMIDDFGTGFSSLASITERHCDIIKLDMSFAQKIAENDKIEKIIIAVIATAHVLNILVVAEGVETKEQYEFLRDAKCDYIQGYYFAKPMSKEEYETLLDTEGVGE